MYRDNRGIKDVSNDVSLDPSFKKYMGVAADRKRVKLRECFPYQNLTPQKINIDGFLRNIRS